MSSTPSSSARKRDAALSSSARKKCKTVHVAEDPLVLSEQQLAMTAINQQENNTEEAYMHIVVYGKPSQAPKRSRRTLRTVNSPSMLLKAGVHSTQSTALSTKRAAKASTSTSKKKVLSMPRSAANKCKQRSTNKRKARDTPLSVLGNKRKAAPRSVPANKRIPKPPPPFPDVTPQFAMIAKALPCYNDPTKVLDIGEGAGSWNFDIRRHLLSIMESNPGCHLYLVGYRHEESAVIPSVHGSIWVQVPFFTVHVLPKDAPVPARVAVRDLERKTLDYYWVKATPLHWEKVATSGTGQQVIILVNKARTTSRSTLHRITCSGGQLWFPIPLNDKENPVLDSSPIVLDVDNEPFYFVAEMWDTTLATLEELLTNKRVTWDEFCDWEETPWVNKVLGPAVDAFFDYEEEVSRVKHAEKVSDVLAKALRAFKVDRDAEQRLYRDHQWYANNVNHYKIYPENDCLREFLAKGCSDSISQWCGKPAAVYPSVPVAPVVPVQEAAAAPKLDLWGNPF